MDSQRSKSHFEDAETNLLKEGISAKIHTVADYMAGTVPPPKTDATSAPADGRMMQDVAKRLWTKFGPGDNPALRRELYERLERSVKTHGFPAYRVIQSCVRSADTANNPQRYFCTAVCNRMRESGFMDEVQGGAF